jgi:hypothetical protein
MMRAQVSLLISVRAIVSFTLPQCVRTQVDLELSTVQSSRLGSGMIADGRHKEPMRTCWVICVALPWTESFCITGSSPEVSIILNFKSDMEPIPSL